MGITISSSILPCFSDMLIQLKMTISGSPVEVEEMWSKIEREKAAGGYPWTHLNHNENEEVWINPLKLPEDITRYGNYHL